MDVVAKMMVNAAVFGTPIAIGICWWVWFRRDRTLSPRWRVQALLIGLSSVSANAILYYSWFAYGSMTSNADAASELRNTLGNYIAVPLVVLALAGALGGKGATRLLVACSAVAGFFLWLGLGIL